MNETHAVPAAKMRLASHNFKNLAGQKFSRLTVLGEAGRTPGQNVIWNCACACGGSAQATSRNLTSGKTRSCGCLQREKAAANGRARRVGSTEIPAHAYRKITSSWRDMIRRCLDAGAREWPSYGGRGIMPCERWMGRAGMARFVSDMWPTWQPGLTLDRIDNDKGYAPENCRWATHPNQARNRSNNLMLTVDGVTKCLKDWAAEKGMDYGTLQYRYHHWPREHIFDWRCPHYLKKK